MEEEVELEEQHRATPEFLGVDSLKKKMHRNASTPGFGKLTRLDSTIDGGELEVVLEDYKRRPSSYLVYAIQVIRHLYLTV